MKRLFLLFFLVLSLGLLFTSCGEYLPEGEVRIVAVNFAGYDFAREVAGRGNGRVSVELMAAGDSHSFNPTFRDVAKVQSCDLLIYVGGESDSGVEALLASCSGVNTFRMIDHVPLLEEEHDHDSAHEHEHEEEEYDEHVWTSPENAVKIVEALAEAMASLDTAYAASYRSNAASYREELLSLDREFREFFADGSRPLVFGDRFPFLYFAKSYHLTCYAAFSGCGSSSEPTTQAIAELIDIVEREGVTTVFYIESGTHAVAERIAGETGCKTALFHSCHKVSPEEIEAGVTYLSLMRRNLEALRAS